MGKIQEELRKFFFTAPLFITLITIFSFSSTINANATVLNDMYSKYKDIITSYSDNSSELINTNYDLYDIDKDNLAELFLFKQDYNKDYSEVIVYTYKNGKVQQCGKFSANNQFAYNTLCEDEYGNGVGISGGSGAGWEFHLYVLNGTELVKTGQVISVTRLFDEQLNTEYYLNDKAISANTVQKYFSVRTSYGKEVSNLSYLNKYFGM